MRSSVAVAFLLTALAVPIFSQDTAPSRWVDAARALPVRADGRVMPLETWSRHRGGLEAVLNRVIGDEPTAIPTELLFPPELATTAKKTAAGLYVYWLTQSRAGQWSDAAETMGVLVHTLSNAYGPLPTTSLELLHNGVPWGALLTVLAVLGVVAALLRKPPLERWLVVVPVAALVLLTAWIVLRILVTGRPPVTNLPSTFLLVAWLTMLAAVFLALRPAHRTTALVLLVSGCLLPLLSAVFQADGDPFRPVQAVLNTNFWLAIHVTTIVSGYASTLVAALIAHVYLGVAGGKKGGGKLLPLWKALRFSLLTGLVLTLMGTLLGGFWADQSWGRFWGWDPKENGALLIILWLSLVLHLRPAGLAQEWGTALGAAMALPVLLLSWMGVNLLGQGFHSYGTAPGKALVFWGLLGLDALIVSLLIVRKVLR